MNLFVPNSKLLPVGAKAVFTRPGISYTNPSFPGGASGKESACQCRRGKISMFDPCVGWSAGVGNGNPLQYSCLENPTDRGSWWASVLGCLLSLTWLSTRAYNSFHFSDAYYAELFVFQTMLITCHPLDKCSVLSPFLQIKKLGFRVIKLVAGHTAGAS